MGKSNWSHLLAVGKITNQKQKVSHIWIIITCGTAIQRRQYQHNGTKMSC